MVHQGIYISPNDVRANKDREESKTNLILDKNKIVDKLVKTEEDINYLISKESSVDLVMRLFNLQETIQLALNYINNERNN